MGSIPGHDHRAIGIGDHDVPGAHAGLADGHRLIDGRYFARGSEMVNKMMKLINDPTASQANT